MTDFHVFAGSGDVHQPIPVRKIDGGDLVDALRLGFADFWEKPSHYVFLCLIYPVVGLILAAWTSGSNLLPLLFPLMSGFALLGPFLALGLYEISRRRELGLDTSWRHALEVRRSPALPSIAAIGILLFAVFIFWLLVAEELYVQLYGPEPPASIGAFLSDVFSTTRGWTLIILGNAIGFILAAVVLCTTVIAFPLLLDRDVGAYKAMETSVRAVAANPVAMAGWGIIVAVALVVGSLPLFALLAVVMPVLGHGTWHLYRKVVAPEPGRGTRPG